MAILITGGTGFIGLHTARAFLDAGETVVATQFRVRRDPPFIRDALGGRLQREALDITSPFGLRDLMRKHAISGIVHLAVPGYRALSPSEEYRSNVTGLVNVLECAQLFGVGRVTIASSLAVYAGLPGPAYAESALLPIPSSNPTTAFKKAEEVLGLHFADRAGLDVVFARIGAIYGPLYHSMANVPSRLVHRAVHPDAAIRTEDIVPGERRDYCYVRDCAEALRLLQTSTLRERIYNVGSGRSTTHAELAAAVQAAVPGAELPLGPETDRTAEMDGALDLTAIARDTGYQPRYDVGAAIADYVAWVRENPY